MEYRNRKTGEVLSYQALLVASPSVYIPPQPTADYLADVGDGYDIVFEVPQPNEAYSDSVRDGIEEVDGRWLQKWNTTPWDAKRIADYQAELGASARDALNEQRESKWTDIKAKRSEIKFGGVLVDGHWFHSDTDSRVQWLNLERKAQNKLVSSGKLQDILYIDGQPLAWKTMANAFVPVSVQLAFRVVEAMEVLDARAHKAAEIHNAAMRAVENPKNYDYTAGWPEIY